MTGGLIYVKDHCVKPNLDDQASDYIFVQLADPQLALLERYIEHRDPPFKWDRELALFDRAISAINNLPFKPKFVIICGDLVDAEPGKDDRQNQVTDLKNSIGKLHLDTPVFVLPGNHDICNEPSLADIEDYRSHWGDDYYVFWYGKDKYVVVNSQPYWNSSNCPEEASSQDAWLATQLSAPDNANADNVVIFQVSLMPFALIFPQLYSKFNYEK